MKNITVTGTPRRNSARSPLLSPIRPSQLVLIAHQAPPHHGLPLADREGQAAADVGVSRRGDRQRGDRRPGRVWYDHHGYYVVTGGIADGLQRGAKAAVLFAEDLPKPKGPCRLHLLGSGGCRRSERRGCENAERGGAENVHERNPLSDKSRSSIAASAATCDGSPSGWLPPADGSGSRAKGLIASTRPRRARHPLSYRARLAAGGVERHSPGVATGHRVTKLKTRRRRGTVRYGPRLCYPPRASPASSLF